ncbi:GNAT family N-acetyltransferase [Roseovarius sp. SCSIO 43702]|uniref:GNAT family N-acetyltransferase n=1 Tax=Roseovarius sp. SCSIO 43702 TaxID=2823043 RepID=UPI001C72A4AF|nr:GNAT family N-acetyltransferase [Roseovarius sp. SCSIO 43702]QYX55372.1 GNAT family N-acetyltransferase [Roseovarius sp. SCSIO 43702]
MNLEPFTTILKNGETVLVREVGPGDRDLLEAGFEHLSKQSRFFRFLAPHNELTQQELDRFSAPNDFDHVAIGALTQSAPAPEPVGIARYIRIPDTPARAEVAVTIVDSHQRIGLGSLLLGTLAKLASRNGVSEFLAVVHKDNTAMLALFDALGGRRTRIDGEMNYTISLPDDPEDFPRTSVGEAFRTAYRLAHLT